MKRVIGLMVLFLVVGASLASAQGATVKAGLGFHSIEAPIGLRWWVSPKWGIDGGIGFGSEEVPPETFSHFAFDLGVPIALKTWDRVYFLFRPGIAYRSQEVAIPGGTGNDTALGILGELEGELFLAENFSVSAAHGIAIINTDPAAPGADSTTDYGTFGDNFTTVGFHVYLFGGSR